MTDELPSKVVRSNGTHEVLAHAVKVVNPHLLDGTFGRYAANKTEDSNTVALKREPYCNFCDTLTISEGSGVPWNARTAGRSWRAVSAFAWNAVRR
jgi:hypothetical protein